MFKSVFILLQSIYFCYHHQFINKHIGNLAAMATIRVGRAKKSKESCLCRFNPRDFNDWRLGKRRLRQRDVFLEDN